MIEILPTSDPLTSQAAVLGFRVSGDVTKADYDVLTSAVESAVEAHGSVRVLLDLTDLHSEKAEAWGADLHFGRELHDEIERMAIVGDRTWQRWLTHLARPFYAKDAQFFENQPDAWAWLTS
jgi:hypothetical protein